MGTKAPGLARAESCPPPLGLRYAKPDTHPAAHFFLKEEEAIRNSDTGPFRRTGLLRVMALLWLWLLGNDNTPVQK